MKKLSTLGCRVTMFAVLSLLPTTGFSEDKKADDKIGNYRVEGIDVVQGRVFRKAGRHELSILGGAILNNTFVTYELAQIKYGYHFREGLAFEGYWAHAFSQTNGILNDLANIPCPTDAANYIYNKDGSVKTGTCGISLENKPDPLTNAYFGNIVWSPIYGKFAIFSKKIFHFDLYLTAGAGLWQTEAAKRFAFNVGAGSKIFVNEWMAVLVDFRNFTVRESAPFSAIANNRLISLGLSFFLPPHPVRD